MRIIINTCYGGYSLSKKAVKRMADIQGTHCFFFKSSIGNGNKGYEPLSVDDEAKTMFWTAFTIPNPNDFLVDGELPNKKYCEIEIESRPENRSDPVLLQVVEELGKEADGQCAELKIVEIPDGVQYHIDEYDGIESIHEDHRSWD